MEAHSQPSGPTEAAAVEAPAVEGAEKPSGPIAAVMIAAGIGALVLAILVIWAEASVGFKESLQYDDEVGPLSGKTIWAAVAFVVSWGALHLGLRGRSVDLGKATLISAILLGLGYLGTFSPFFQLFTSE